MSFDEARDVVARTEESVRERFASDVATEVVLVDVATTLLLSVLVRVQQRQETLLEDPETGALEGDIDTLRLSAQTLIGVRAFRSIRAGRAVLASGYEAEARAHDRVLVELLAHRRAIHDDQTGKEALAWVRGKRGRGISQRVKAVTPQDLYGNLSAEAHGDPRPVARLLDKETRTIQIAPCRSAATRASLLMYAGFARDQAVVIAQLAVIKLEGLQDLDDGIRGAWDQLRTEPEAWDESNWPDKGDPG